MSAAPSYSILGLIGLVILVCIVVAIALVCVLLATRRKTRAAPSPAAPAAAAIHPEARNERREAILERLANKEISREDAEQQLLELDNPLPEQMPVIPPPARGGCGSGCLVALICGGVAFVILMLLLFGMFFARAQPVAHHHNQIRFEEMR